MILPFLTIAPSENRGKGVFATKNIAKGTIVEISPVLVLSPKDRKQLEATKLTNYIFEWGDSRRKAAMALGYISMYNHSYDANCEYEMDFDDEIMTIKTVKPIKKGEELFINYNATPDDKTEVWFHHLIKES
ncbi:SET domain-containing protein-lysine N-methyltransferase [Arachidicoccus ginsenosidimutans]|uniref:SET domain-containing protein n=1 Tax=Arachidicoccus sp. BS20 TaxID=1850526 RepID=UPI0007F1294C|nr:SET domain-containing protein [Arachidicoccus sp. BS20]ANI89027.1 SET domain-containing protein-lysine N-methyltransferase [Arachidicoccus sp. BS20]